jgi:hypothetical protein
VTQVLVSDTSVLIDLDRGGLLEAAFALPFRFTVPDLLYKRELQSEEGPRLLELGLEIAGLDDQQVGSAQNYQASQFAISLPDAFALVLAKSMGCRLLTGDQNLRRLADSEKVACHGVLWLFDQMLGIYGPERLYHGLTQLAEHRRCRLPKAEIAIRRQTWAAAAGIETR